MLLLVHAHNITSVDLGPDGDLGGVGVAIGAVAAADDAVIDDDSSVVVSVSSVFFLVYFTSLILCL